MRILGPEFTFHGFSVIESILLWVNCFYSLKRNWNKNVNFALLISLEGSSSSDILAIKMLPTRTI